MNCKTSPVLIYLDPGHGGSDPGAVGSTAREKDIALAVARLAGSMLTSRGFAVCYSRTSDVRVLVNSRTRQANRLGAAAFVSIHCNGAANATASGVETFAYNRASRGYRLAQQIQQNLVAATGLADRGVKTANFAVLRDTAMPAALVELGFLTTPVEEALLCDAAWQQRAAAAIVQGIVACCCNILQQS